jgi:parvulin-like peptidyl-prolyl isomerase
MPVNPRPTWAILALFCSSLAFAQAPTPAPSDAPAAPRTAATVNGQPILDEIVERGLDAPSIPANKKAEIRAERLNVLIDDMLIDQYLQQLMIPVEAKEVDGRIAEMRTELLKQKKDFDKLLKEWKITEAELRQHITSELRWEKFVDQRANDKVLQETFDGNKEVFDGTQVRARHILVTAKGADEKAGAEAQAQVSAIKKEIEDKVASEMAKQPADLDNLAREKARQKAIDDAFAGAAKGKSSCPSKANGGDVGWFQRAGFMVEPFSRAAFALKPYQISDVVKTPFGYHLILAVDRKAGRDVKFTEAKEMVKEYYANTLREALAAQIRPKSKIEIFPAPAAAATPLPAPKGP